MDYLGSAASSLLTTAFLVFTIIAAGYLVGRVSIKGISLGTAGVLIVALMFGIFSDYVPYITVGGKTIALYLTKAVTLNDGTTISATKGQFSLVSSIGTSLFVTAVGLIAGPKFFRMFNKRSLGYILIGIIVILTGTLISLAIIAFSKDENVTADLVIGLMTGALTSTPGFSAAKEVALDGSKVTAGFGIAYLFGIVGVVLFVQLIPRILKVDMEKERREFTAANMVEVPAIGKHLISMDRHGFFAFAVTIVFGQLIGCIRIPGLNFSLGASGGTLIAGLIIGHFGHIGPLDCSIDKKTLHFFRELGLCFFLVGAGVSGGVNFISNVKLSYFIYGAMITLIPMVIGFLLGRYVFRLSVFNNLGAITGGMTSTPALGALIATAETEDVASAYAATYPFALFCVVISARTVASIL